MVNRRGLWPPHFHLSFSSFFFQFFFSQGSKYILEVAFKQGKSRKKWFFFTNCRCMVALNSAHQPMRELLWAAGIDVCCYVQPGKPHRLQSTQGCWGQNVTSRTNCCELFAKLKRHKNASIMTWHWSTKYDVFVLDGMYDKKGYQFVLNEGDIIHTWSAGKERKRIDWEKVKRGSSDAGAEEKFEQENNWKFEIKWIWTMKCWTHSVVLSNKEEEEVRIKTFGILRSIES